MIITQMKKRWQGWKRGRWSKKWREDTDARGRKKKLPSRRWREYRQEWATQRNTEMKRKRCWTENLDREGKIVWSWHCAWVAVVMATPLPRCALACKAVFSFSYVTYQILLYVFSNSLHTSFEFNVNSLGNKYSWCKLIKISLSGNYIRIYTNSHSIDKNIVFF